LLYNAQEIFTIVKSSCKTARAFPKPGKRPAKLRELFPSRANVLQNREGFSQAGQTSCKTARKLYHKTYVLSYVPMCLCGENPSSYPEKNKNK
jgi:hypothetical protein